MVNYFSYNNASFWKRLAAFYLAFFFVFSSSTALMALAYYGGILDCQTFDYKFWLISSLVFVFLFFTDELFQCLLGANLAKKILGLRVIDSNNAEKISLFNALLRTFFAFLSFIFFGLGFVAIAFNAERKALHDLLSRTRVIDKTKSRFLKAFRNLLTIAIVLIGLVFNAIYLLIFISSPVLVYKNLVSAASYSSYETDGLNPQAKANGIKFKVNNKKLTAMAEYLHADSGSLEPIDFELDLNASQNLISKEDLKKLEIKLLDYDLHWQDNKIRRSILLPRFTLRDLDSQDLIFKNIRFFVDESDKASSTLSKSLFSFFDYNYNANKSLLELKVFKGDKQIIDNNKYSNQEKEYLIHQLYLIRTAWSQNLKYLTPQQIKVFGESKHKLSNAVSLLVTTNDAYIKNAVLEKASKNKDFDLFTENFIQNLDKLRFLPKSLKVDDKLELKLLLEYQELI